ncbi:MAG TPA: ATP-binding protein [Opitutaceae bacterium]
MNSIRTRLTRNVLTAVLLLLITGVFALCGVAYDGALNLFDDMLEARAESIMALTERREGRVEVGLNDAMRRSFSGDDSPDQLYFQVWDHNGRTIKRSPSLDDDDGLPRRTGTVDDPTEWNITLPDGQRGRAMGMRFQPYETAAGRPGGEEVFLVVASDREDLDETLVRMVVLALVWTGLLVGTTLWVVPRVLRKGLRPLERLGEQAAGIDAGSLATRFATDQLPVELEPIASRLNALLGRLEESFERERRFSADLAHELRTPLAELRSLAESSLRWPDRRDPRTDDDVLAISLQMERIVTHILALARGEQGQLTLVLEPVELKAVTEDVWRHFSARAAERGVTSRLELDAVAGRADRALLRAVLVNLIENAVDYASPGTVIVMRVARERELVTVRITNEAADLGRDDVGRLFDRFWRKESSRSGGGVHVGLGLSLARAFAESMGWTLTAMREEDGRLTMALNGPGADGSKPSSPSA